MKYVVFDAARSEYFTGGYVRPSMEELKRDGRWDFLPEKTKRDYLEERRYKLAHPEVTEQARRVAKAHGYEFYG